MGKDTAISPEANARWRKSELGALTEALEREAVFGLTGDLNGLRVLDVGCGDGAYSIHAFRLGATVTGLDVSQSMLDAARRRADAAGVSIEWRQGRAEALPFPPSSFDVVIAVTVLCWVSNPATALREMARVVRAGGAVIIGELGRYSLWHGCEGFADGLGYRFWREAHFWTRGELRRLVESGGFKFGAARGAVYYPPSGPLAKWLVPLDGSFSRMTPARAGRFSASGLASRRPLT